MSIKLKILKKELEHKIGFSIDTVSSCRRLEQILKTEGKYVSYTTLSRIFGIANISATARESTLNELSQFLGFSHFESFIDNHAAKEHLNRIKVITNLEIDALLLRNQTEKAIDYLMDLKEKYPPVFRYHSQFICKHLFEKPEPAKKSIDHLLSFSSASEEIFQHFVYEDDPYGHYSKALKLLYTKYNKDENLLMFSTLFGARKTILKKQHHPSQHFDFDIPSDAHYHIVTRKLEIELLLGKFSKEEIHNRTDEIIDLIEKSSDNDLAFAYVGRWCRGLLFSNKHDLLKNHHKWREQCQRLLNFRVFNIEFQVIIFSFVQITYGIAESLDFMFRGRWENSKLESQLLLSLAFDKTAALKTYKKALGYRV